jgi:hypothetical protein
MARSPFGTRPGGFASSAAATFAASADASRLLLDSAVLIDALRGRPAEEVWRGLRPSEHGLVRRLFGGLRVAPLGVGAGLATANVDDFPMPSLAVEHWPPGE